MNPESAQIWLDGSGVLADIKIMLGMDPKKGFEDGVSSVTFT